MASVAIIIYSTYGHILGFAKEEKKGIESAGGKADIFQVPETLPSDVLTAIGAPGPDDSIPVVTLDVLTKYDALLFGFPTRFGSVPSQVKSFWDSTGALWSSGALHGKPFGLFVSTGSPQGGQEITIRNTLSMFVHHGMIYVPLGYGRPEVFAILANLEEVHGGSPWGAGMYAGADGSRSASEKENKLAFYQGEEFYKVASKLASTSAVSLSTSEDEVLAQKEEAEKAEKVEKAEKIDRSTVPVSADKEEKSGSKCCVVM